jgi:hypothetical protein
MKHPSYRLVSPVEAKAINIYGPKSNRVILAASEGFSTMTIAVANFRDNDLGFFYNIRSESVNSNQ